MSDATHVTVGLGQTATCTITNSDTSAQLTLTKVVLGGAKTTADFTLTATGPTTISGVSGSGTVTSAAVNAGTYTLSETTDPNYTASTWSCTNGVAVTAGHITLAAGQVTTCTITNTTTLGVSVNSTTSCSAFSTGALSGLFVDSLSYALANNGNVANSISPNTFAYYSRVTITAGQTITITQGNDQAAVPLFTTTKNLVTVYDTSCNTVTKTVDVTNLAAVAITGVPAGTYIVQVRFDSQPVVGTAPPSPTSVHYSFTTKAGATVVDHNGNGVDLIKR
jgi:hypothetical protein